MKTHPVLFAKDPWDWYICLNWLIFMVNVGKYMPLPWILWDWFLIGTVTALFSDLQFLTFCNLFTACFSFIEKFRPLLFACFSFIEKFQPLLFFCIYCIYTYIYIYGLVLSCAHIDLYVYSGVIRVVVKYSIFDPFFDQNRNPVELFGNLRKSPHNPRHPRSWNP